MRKHGLPFIVVSNVFLLFPITAALYVGNWLYFIFGFFILIASIGFHYTHYYNQRGFSLTRFLLGKKKYKDEKYFRVADWLLATVGSLYVFYYIYTSTAGTALKLIFASLFLSVLVFFIVTYKFGNYDKYHPWFHVFAQTILGFIILLF